MSLKLSSSKTWKLVIILNIWEHTYISIQISQTILILYARNSEAVLNFSVCQPRDRETESPCFNMSACYGHFTPVNKNKPTKAVNDLCSTAVHKKALTIFTDESHTPSGRCYWIRMANKNIYNDLFIQNAINAVNKLQQTWDPLHPGMSLSPCSWIQLDVCASLCKVM